MGRPRTATDGDIFAAIVDVIAEGGPSSVTLSRVGERAGVTASALVQRFGSRRDMLAAFRASAATGDAPLGEDLGRPALEALREVLRSSIPKVVSRREMANQLAYQLSEEGAASQAGSATRARALTRTVHDLTARASEGGQLPRCDAERFAGTVEAAWYGAQVSWALCGTGLLDSWVMARVDAVIELCRAEPSPQISEPDGLIGELAATEERRRARRTPRTPSSETSGRPRTEERPRPASLLRERSRRVASR